MENESSRRYMYYACFKNGHNGGHVGDARKSCELAYEDLKRLEGYVRNDLIYFGVIKCKDDNPLSHIKDI